MIEYIDEVKPGVVFGGDADPSIAPLVAPPWAQYRRTNGERWLNVEKSDGSLQWVMTEAGPSGIISAASSAVLSTANSSTTPLSNNAAFTGISESTLVYEGASVAVFTDQPGALQVQQSPNGTDWDISELFNVPASGFSTPVNFRGAFFRVIFTNNSGSNQTIFRLQTVKRPILNAMQAPAAHGVTLQNGVSGLAVGSNLGTSKYATALVQLTITGTATVTFQASNDGGVTWTAINAHSLGTDVIATTATLSGLYRINVVGLMLIRANVTARSSGTITAVGYASVLPPSFSSIALASRSNIIGQVGIDQTTPGSTDHITATGSSDQITPSFTPTTGSAYAAGNVLGSGTGTAGQSGVLTLASAMRVSGGTGVLQSLLLLDHANQKPAIDILIFDSAPISTFTDKVVCPTLAAADNAKLIRRLSIAASDYVTVGGTAIAEIAPIGKLMKASGSANLYAVVVLTTGTPTFPAATDLILRLGFLRD